jgi:hypothetical protein
MKNRARNRAKTGTNLQISPSKTAFKVVLRRFLVQIKGSTPVLATCKNRDYIVFKAVFLASDPNRATNRATTNTQL